MPEHQQKSDLLSRVVQFSQEAARRVHQAGGFSAVLEQIASQVPGYKSATQADTFLKKRFPEQYAEAQESLDPVNMYGPGSLTMGAVLPKPFGRAARLRATKTPATASQAGAPGEALLTVHPESFLKKAAHPDAPMSNERIAQYRAQLRAGEKFGVEIDVPEMVMDESGQNVVSVEGRHRAAAALQEGLTEIPVKRSIRREVPAEDGGTVYVIEDEAPLKAATGEGLGTRQAEPPSAAVNRAAEREPSGEQLAQPEEHPLVKSLTEKYGTTTDVRKAGFILPDGRMVPLSGEHDTMLSAATGQPISPKREQFLQESGALRSRSRSGRAGDEMVFSVPESGVTDSQRSQIRDAAALMPNGRIIIEQATPAGRAFTLDFPTEESVDNAIGALSVHAAEQTKMKAASEILWLTRETGGVTWHPTKGNLAGTEHFAVGAHPERGVVMDTEPTLKQIREFERENADLFEKGDRSVGLWEEKATGKWHLDVSATPSSLEEAMTIARAGNQKAIFDLKTMQEIPVEGLRSELLEAAKAGRPVADWWARSRDAIDTIAAKNPQAATEIRQMLAATSAQKPNEAGAAIALNFFHDWQKAGRPTDLSEIKALLAPYKSLSALPKTDVPKLGYVARGEPGFSADPRNKKITEMAKVLGGDETAVVLDAHMRDAFGQTGTQQMRGPAYDKAATQIRDIAAELEMTPSETQAAIWATTRVMKGAETLDDALRSLTTGDILKSGEDYADLFFTNPDVRAAAERVIRLFGDDPKQTFAGLEKLLQRPRKFGKAERLSTSRLERFGRRIRGEQ